VLCVPRLKNNFFLVSVMEDKSFFVIFHRGKVLIRLEKSILDTTVVVRAKEGTLYMFKLWYMTLKTYVSYGIGGWDTYTTWHC
jgi:hypothetical protein